MKTWKQSLCAALAAVLLVGCSGSPAQPESASPAPETPTTSESTPEPAPVQPAQPSEDAPEAPKHELIPEPTEPTEPSTSQEPLVSSGSVGWVWFDDAVFIGDSVSLKLKNYVTKQRQNDAGFLGGAQFLTSGSLGSANALWEVSDQSVHPAYQGEKMLLEESIPLTGAKKIYIMLGTNDIGLYGIEDSVKNYQTLLERILETTPDASIYVQSATPICEGAEKKALNNANLEIYNEQLQALCEEKGYTFVDVASVLRDENGFLPRDYCSDPDGMGIHFTDVACEIWIDYLRTDAVRYA